MHKLRDSASPRQPYGFQREVPRLKSYNLPTKSGWGVLVIILLLCAADVVILCGIAGPPGDGESFLYWRDYGSLCQYMMAATLLPAALLFAFHKWVGPYAFGLALLVLAILTVANWSICCDDAFGVGC